MITPANVSTQSNIELHYVFHGNGFLMKCLSFDPEGPSLIGMSSGVRHGNFLVSHAPTI